MAVTRTAKGTFQTKSGSGTRDQTLFTALTVAAGETLLVGLANNGAGFASSMTWNGLAMTKVLAAGDTGVGTLATVQLYAIYSAAGGTGNVVASSPSVFWSTSSAIAAWASTFTDLDPTSIDQNASGTNGSAQSITTAATGTLAQADELLVAHQANIGPNGDVAGTWGSDITTAGQRLGSTGGSATANVTVSEGYTLSTASTAAKTASKSGMTTANRAHACIIGTFKKFAGPQTLTPAATVASWVVGASILLGSGSATPLTPAAATAAWAVPAPALAFRVAAPTAPVATWTVPAPTITKSAVTLAPAAASATWAVPASTVGGATGAGTLLTSVTPSGTRHDFTGCVGLKFTPTVNILITALGRWRVAGNTQTHTLRLMRESAGVLTDLATVVVDCSSGPVAAFKYATLASPIPLTAGTTYHLFSSETNLGDDWNDDSPVTTASIAAPVTAVFQTPCGSSGYTDNPSGPNRAYGQVDAQWTTVPTLLPAAAVATWTVPASTVRGVSLAVAPAAVSASWTVPASVLSAAPVTVAPGAVVATWAVPVPTLTTSGGPQTLTPVAVVATWAVPASTLAASALTLTPTATVAAWVAPTSTMNGSGPIPLAPGAVAAAWVVPASTVSGVTVTLAPGAATASWSVPASTLAPSALTLAPAAVPASWTVPASLLTTGAIGFVSIPAVTTWTVPASTVAPSALTLAPGAAVATWTVPGSTLASGATLLTPGAATAAWVVSASTLTALSATLAPGAALATWAVPASAITGTAVLAPGAATASWVVPASAISVAGSGTLAPAAAVASWAVPNATLTLGTAIVIGPPAVVATWTVPAHALVITPVVIGAPSAPVATWTVPGSTLASGGSVTLARVAVPRASWAVPAPTVAVGGVLTYADVPYATWGVPTPILDAQGHDPNCECCMATKLKVANQALLKIGVSQTIVAFTEQTREAYTIAELFDESLREAQRSYPWAFATQYVTPALYIGSPTAPANGDWIYAYVYPADCLFVRRLVRAGIGRAFDPTPPRFRIGRAYGLDSVSSDDDVMLIYSNEPNLEVEYTKEVKCSLYYGDAVFEDALSWLVASKIAPSLSRDSKMAEKCFAMYVRAFAFASALSAQEQQQDVEGEAEWIRDRNA